MTTGKNNILNNRCPSCRSGAPRGLRGKTEDVVFTSCSRCFLIDTQAIRNKILDLAMRGKLTEQLPEDGTADELYRQIQKEKQTLIKAGELKKEITLPEISEKEVPYSLPANWNWVRIGSILTLQAGKNMPASDIQNTSDENHLIPCYGGNGQRGFVDQANADGFHAIIGRQGALCGNINFAEGPFYATEHAVVVSGYAGTDMKWVGMTLRYLNLNQYATSVAQPGLAVSKIDMVPMPLPPLAEQQRIVERIAQASSILDTIDALQSQYADNLTVLKSKLIDAAIQGKLTEQLPEDGTAEELFHQIQAEKQALVKAGKIKKEKPLSEITANEIPFEVSENWKWVRLGALLSMQPSNGFSPKAVGYQTPYKSLTLTATTSGFFKPNAFKYVDITADVAEKYFLEDGDILVQRSNSRDLVGTSCLYRHGNKKYVYPDLMMRMRVMEGISASFIDCVLKTQTIRAFFKKAASGTSESMPKINQETVRNALIPLPPLAEQKRIVAKLEELLPLCEGQK